MSVIITIYILTLWIINNQRENIPKDGLPQPEVEFALGTKNSHQMTRHGREHEHGRE